MSFRIAGARPFSSWRALPLALTLTIWAATGVAQARDLCGNINYLLDQSQSAFKEISDRPAGQEGEHHVTISLAGASKCLVTEKSAGTWYHCAWEFPYRAEQAYDAFEEFVGAMNDCIGRRATVHTDRNVNHPDFYALRRYEMEQADVSVSVKTKGALGGTFVFIRVQGRKGE